LGKALASRPVGRRRKAVRQQPDRPGPVYLTTHDFSVDSLLPVVSETGMFGTPGVRALIARVTRGAAGVIPG
jgi:hypothetical protein